MPSRDDRSAAQPAGPPTLYVPPAAPAWVTLELIEQTLRVWQPYYPDRLIPEDALEIIENVHRLMDALSRGGGHETVRRVGSGEQP